MHSNTISTQNLAHRLLQVISDDILPLTKTGVDNGNKIFGAALLHKGTLKTFLAETNNEVENPLWHGEMHLLKRFYEIPEADRPSTNDLLFLSTHEPCSLCLSAITWCGFDNFYYFFSHEDSRDAFSIPHDLKILKEVFDIDPGQYRKSNAFWDSYDICREAESCQDSRKSDRLEHIGHIKEEYNKLSADYQSDKSGNNIPLN